MNASVNGPAPPPRPRPAAHPRRRRRYDRNWFYRQCRMLHAYLSAFAFLALIFFSATGLLLNHPEWIGSARTVTETTITLGRAKLDAALAEPEPAVAVARLVAGATDTRGAFHSGEQVDGEVFARLDGPTGSTDLAVDLQTGEAEVAVKAAPVLSVINDLHRGKNAGAAWSLFIDASAVVILALSLVGYVLFFTLRMRLANSLRLTAASLALMGGVFIFLVP